MDFHIILSRLIKEHTEFKRVINNVKKRIEENITMEDLELLREFIHREVDEHACWEEEVLYSIIKNEACINRIMFAHEDIRKKLRLFEDILEGFYDGKVDNIQIRKEAMLLINVIKEHLREEESIIFSSLRKEQE